MNKKIIISVLLFFIILIIFSGCIQQIFQEKVGEEIRDDSNAKVIIEKKPIIKIEEKDPYKCEKICESSEFCNEKGECETVELMNKNYCGNFVCEENEKANGKAKPVPEPVTNKSCFYDCSSECSSEYCNEKIEVQCGCSEYPTLAERHGCVKKAEPCVDCGKQEELFPEVLKIQTKVYDCLVDYFKFKPPKLIYKVFNNPNLEKCKEKEGCIGIEGGVGGADYVLFHNLNGFREFGEITPTKPEHLTADVHESTHYFLYQMLHAVPSWFHEAVAIQTNERINCSDKQTSWGDTYLPEKEGDAGINMDDGTTLGVEFYERLKKGETSLSKQEEKESHILGVLFIIALKKDYNCGFYCFRDIVLKLHEIELKNCLQGKCGIEKSEFEENAFNAMWLGGEDKQKATELIEKATKEVTGKDASKLFELLKLYETEH